MDVSFDYAAFDHLVNRYANALLSAGLQKGDRFATVLPNCTAQMATYWAAAKTGLVIVPMSPLLQTPGLEALLADSGSRLVLADASFAEALTQILPGLEDLPGANCILCNGSANGFRLLDVFLESGMEAPPPDAEIAAEDDYNIMYTSGTTGAPKGIVHTHFVRAMYAALFATSWRMTPESIVLHTGSIVFNGAMLDLMPWMYVGCTYILHDRFDAGRLIAEVEASRVTHMVMVPSQIIAMLDHPDFDPSRMQSLEMILSVGAPLLLEHKQRLNTAMPNVFYELYGLTEGFVTILDRTDALRKAGSVGCPPPFYTMRILREDGTECESGETGEICGRGPILMKGYHNRPDLTADTIRDDWLHSGDLGYVDEDGFLFLVDRKKDMIISGGVNVYPKDIEEIAATHPDIAEVAVFGMPDEKWGEVPVAAVTIRPGIDPQPEALRDWINARASAKFQRLAALRILNELPRNVAGKTLKRDLRNEWRAD